MDDSTVVALLQGIREDIRQLRSDISTRCIEHKAGCDRMHSDHEGRIRTIETTHTHQSGMLAVVATLAGIVGSIVVAAVHKLMGG